MSITGKTGEMLRGGHNTTPRHATQHWADHICFYCYEQKDVNKYAGGGWGGWGNIDITTSGHF